VVDGQRDVDQAPARVAEMRNPVAAATDIAALRDKEIQRLLAENAQLNQRVVSLLKVLEQQQPRSAPRAAPDTGGNAVAREVKAALETELRPVLDVLLRLLEAMRAPPARREPPQPPAPHHDCGIIDLDAPRAHE
jgi:hypothetical protein